MADWQDGLSFYKASDIKLFIERGEENSADALSRLTREAQDYKDSKTNDQTVGVISTSTETTESIEQNESDSHRGSQQALNSEQADPKAILGNLNAEIETHCATKLNQTYSKTISSNIAPVGEADCTSPNDQDTKTTSQNKWLEVVFDFDNTVKVSSLETHQNRDNDNETKEKVPDIILKQQQCPDFKHIYDYLANNELPSDEKLRRTTLIEKEYYDLLDGILMHRYQPRSKKKPTDEKFIFQIALPKQMRLKAIQEFHDNNGHFGFKKVYAAIQAKYYWPHMFQQINDYIK